MVQCRGMSEPSAKTRQTESVQSIPSEVHAELRKLRKIPDHRVGMHEWDIQCEWRGFANTQICP